MSYTKEQLKLRAHIKEAIYENISEVVQRNASKLYCLLEDNVTDLPKLAKSFGLPICILNIYMTSLLCY